MEGLITADEDVLAERRVEISRGQMAHKKSGIGMREREHLVGGKHLGQPVKIEFLQQQHERKRTSFFPHGTLFVGQALCRLDAEFVAKALLHHDVKQRLLVDVVHELHQPVSGSFIRQGSEQREKFFDV